MKIPSNFQISPNNKFGTNLLREFAKVYGETLDKTHSYQFIKIADKYASHKWMYSTTYNSLIKAFGLNFDKFSLTELASFNASLAKAGLRQVDIMNETVEKFKTLTEKNKDEKAKYSEKYQVKFEQTGLALFKSIVDLNMTSLESFPTLISDDFNKKAFFGDATFFEHAVRKQGIDHVELLSTVLKSKLDQSDERFTKLADELLTLVNANENV